MKKEIEQNQTTVFQMLSPATSFDVLKTRDLSVGYKKGNNIHLLFEKLNLTLAAGQLVCFMGPNGIGKSTLIRALAGLQNPLSGEVSLTHFRQTSGSPKREDNIAVVLTDPVTATNMTVRELVTYGRYPFLNWRVHLSSSDTAVIEQSLEQINILSLADKKLYELSDGQLQMAMIARALAQNTPILLLDEPTAHLDLNNRLEIMNLLRSVCRTTGKAILMATHELDLALQTADLIWLATHSKTIKSALPEDMVLDGAIDDVFQFKGFDLKTGKVDHEAYRGISVHLIGEGHAFLWTKNALERNGFEVSSEGKIKIEIGKENGYDWTIIGHKKFMTLSDLIHELKKNN